MNARKIERVIVAYDGSDGARRALELIPELVAGRTVTVLGIAEGIPLLGHAGALHSDEQEAERARQLAEAAELLAERGIETRTVGQTGDAAAAILEQAEEDDVDLVVMGTRGLSTGQRWLMGSVSNKVLHHARCSVLVVR